MRKWFKDSKKTKCEQLVNSSQVHKKAISGSIKCYNYKTTINVHWQKIWKQTLRQQFTTLLLLNNY